MRHGLAFGVFMAVASCTDDAPEPLDPLPPVPVAWNAVCGTEGPHPLLPLAEGEHASRVEASLDEGRVLVSTFFVDPQVPLSAGPPTLDRAIVSVGTCGEQPRTLARGLSPAGRHGSLTLACGEGGHGAWALDLDGVAPPRSLIEGWCPLRSTDAGLLAVEAPPDAEHGPLVLLRDPEDPQATPQVLADRIRPATNAYYGPGGSSSTSLWAAGGEAIGLDVDGSAWRIDLASGQRVELLQGVRELRVSGDGRRVIWQALEPTSSDEPPAGPVFLHDRETDTDLFLLDTHLEWTGSAFVAEYLMLRDDAEGLRLWWADGTPIERPAGTEVRGVLEGGELWLARRVDDHTEELRWHPATGGEPFVFARHAGTVTRRGDGIEIFETDDAPAPTEGSLSFVPFTGGEPVVLAHRVHQTHGRIADGRILTVVGVDPSDHGELRLIDPDGGDIVGLDLRGYVRSPRLGVGDPFDGDVVFATAGGERERGIYRGRVAR